MQQPDGSDDHNLCDEVLADYFARIDRGESVDREQLIAENPEVAEELRVYFADSGVVARALRCSSSDSGTIGASARLANELRDPEGAGRKIAELEPHPSCIGRYRVERLLGLGAFGRVFLAHDDDLNRPVAIKVPHRYRVSNAEDVEAYLTEARLVARLDHPGIVPVHDVGRTDDGLCYVVSKFIEGGSLQKRFKQGRFSHVEAAELTAAVAEALHDAHLHGLVHRDVKPANILLDAAGRPHVADFGLALNEREPENRGRYAGTPAYMSPEQARGEGHRVDGRADVFALGVVLYEILTGRRPFAGKTQTELLQQIAGGELQPMRQQDTTIPRELERICLKALAKRVADRYPTAGEMADDLRHFLENAPGSGDGNRLSGAAKSVESDQTASAPSGPSAWSAAAARVVPKGLRCFDGSDADFFLSLLPGPRDRDGLPESIRFWKTRIEEIEPDQAFAVGLIYGPSGCGKSSLVRAGLLPRLADSVLTVYIEAAAEGTETRLLHSLRRRLPPLAGDLGLKESLASLRRGKGVQRGRKVLIVLDQFEQWLNVRHGQEETELVEALRQCDGEHVQCLLLVRDDFWLAINRFMQQLEIRLLEGQNSALVDLFDTQHTIKVLTAFGRAFGALPAATSELTREQKAFLEQAAAGLAEDGKVVCVRLALLAEMMKSRPWTAGSLKEVGGAEGLGVAFLEETFGSSAATPEHRRHHEAARRVLQGLLPELGGNLKGHMLSYPELLELSGYANWPEEFSNLLDILSGQLRLITPADPADARADERGSSDEPQAERGYYQLTHDYLVPSLRDWLSSKDKETRRGRAQLLLADRAALWSARPEQVRLPTLLEWLSIRLWTRPSRWTVPQRRMLRAAARFHLTRTCLALLLFAAVMVALLSVRNRWTRQREADRTAALVSRLLDAEIAQVPDIAEEIHNSPQQTRASLHRLLAEPAAGDDLQRQLRARLILLDTDPSQADWLYRRVLEAGPDELPVLCQALFDHNVLPIADLWRLAEDRSHSAVERFRAACALAGYDSQADRWESLSSLVTEQLVTQNVLLVKQWKDILRPRRQMLVAPLATVFRDRSQERSTQRRLATEILADFAAENLDMLCELVLDADHEQFVALFPTLKQHRPKALALLEAELKRLAPADAAEEARDVLANRQANAAIALLQMGQADRFWALLARRPDPRLRSYLIHLFQPLMVDPERLIERLAIESDPGIRAALILGLGEFPVGELPASRRETLPAVVAKMCVNDPDPGIHGAAQWALRQWKREDLAALADGQKTEAPKENRLGWYVDRCGHTMVVIPGPIEFTLGAPPSVTDREISEGPLRMRIARTFAIADKEVTRAEYERFLNNHPQPQRTTMNPQVRSDGGPNAPIQVNWHEASAYCRWLSEQEGIPEDQMCYPPIDQYEKSLNPCPDYLSRTGYRLPSDAEWEYACLAGAVTVYSFGNSTELFNHYGWSHDNVVYETYPVGSLKPNDFGLFDMHGSLWEWCFESCYHRGRFQTDLEKINDDVEDLQPVAFDVGRITRGGSFYDRPVYARAFIRNPATPRADAAGIRPVRTLSSTEVTGIPLEKGP